jgi:hypothetical protein
MILCKMAPNQDTPLFDHIVILVPAAVLHNLPSWITDAFTVLPGGQHADGLTENKLVIFSDGVYLELIAFVEGLDPEKRNSHKWGNEPEGTIIDWACTLSNESHFPPIQERVKDASTGVAYSDPVPGGRTRPDGKELKWAVAFALSESASVSVERGEASFWCFDRTPREFRVPNNEPGNVNHPSGAFGLAGVTVAVDGAKFEAFSKVYSATHASGSASAEAAAGDDASWSVGTPFPQTTQKASLSLHTRSNNDATSPRTQISLFVSAGATAVTAIEGELVPGTSLRIGLVPV